MGIFHRISFLLRAYPLSANMALSTTVGFCGDVICQTVYEPASKTRPPMRRSQLPSQSAASSLLMDVDSPYLCAKKWWRRWEAKRALISASQNEQSAETTAALAALESTPISGDDTKVLVDFRRSLIFCSYTFLFGVPFFLYVYRVLDRWIPPRGITKRQAVAKGFLSFLAAQVTNPLFVAYVTALDHYFVFRDGRDGRRRVVEIAPVAIPRNPMVFAGDNDDDEAAEADSRALDATVTREKLTRLKSIFRFSFFSQSPQYNHLREDTVQQMGNYYRFVDDKSFNWREYWKCVTVDVTHKLKHDFPDIVRYGFVFWGCNWLPMFYYIPSHFRLFYTACIQVVWSGVMSHLMHRGNRLHLNHRQSSEGHLAHHLITSSN